MTPTELRTSCILIYGQGWNGKEWTRQLADELGRNPCTVWRWANGKLPVPKYASLFLASKRK
jgi:hypothetical protein